MEFTTKYVGKRFTVNGKVGKCIGETDSGNIKLLLSNGQEVWTDFTKLQDVDGASKLFRLFPIPSVALAA